MRSFDFLLFIMVTIACLSFGACRPKPILQPETDNYGCQKPPVDVFTSAGIDVKFAESTFGKVVTGEINIKSDPKVISLASQATGDERIKSYLRCLAIKRDGYTHEQAAYLDRLSAFMSTRPIADQFIKWQEKNQFPSKGDNKKRSYYLPDTTSDSRAILLHITSMNTGEKRTIKALPDANVKWLITTAMNSFDVKEDAVTGGVVPFRVRWILVDSEAVNEWNDIDRYEKHKIFAITKSEDILYFAFDENDTLRSLKVCEGKNFHLYALEDIRFISPPLGF